jgi:hypothetical protein
VCVDEPRHDGAPSGVDDRRVVADDVAGVGRDRGDAVADDRDVAVSELAEVGQQDATVRDDEVRAVAPERDRLLPSPVRSAGL